jgi:hypothetical protein
LKGRKNGTAPADRLCSRYLDTHKHAYIHV